MPAQAQPIFNVGSVLATSGSPLGGRKKKKRGRKLSVVDRTLQAIGRRKKRKMALGALLK